MKRTRPGLTIYSFGMITVMAAVISATTTVFIATRHGEMAARIDALQREKASGEKKTSAVQLAPTEPIVNGDSNMQLYVGAYQPSDRRDAVIQFWIPAEGFTASSDAFSTDEKAACENKYVDSVNALETEIMKVSKGWNVNDINGCWAPSDCLEGACAVCEPGKIFTVVLETEDQMEKLAKRLAAPSRQGLIHKLFCQDETLLVMHDAMD